MHQGTKNRIDATVNFTRCSGKPAIALLQGETELEGITDCFLEVHYPVHWEPLPNDPSEFESIFPRLVRRGRRRSRFQVLLPSDLQVREGIQEWVCDEAIGKVLRRLKGSKPLVGSLLKLLPRPGLIFVNPHPVFIH